MPEILRSLGKLKPGKLGKIGAVAAGGALVLVLGRSAWEAFSNKDSSPEEAGNFVNPNIAPAEAGSAVPLQACRVVVNGQIIEVSMDTSLMEAGPVCVGSTPEGRTYWKVEVGDETVIFVTNN